jgi:hypothetical protein
MKILIGEVGKKKITFSMIQKNLKNNTAVILEIMKRLN